MIAREADPAEYFIGGFTSEMFADEILRHDPPGSRRARAEKKRLALDLGREILGGFQSRFSAGDEVALEVDILRPLSDRLRAGHSVAGLDSSEAAKPGKLDIVVDEGSDRGRIGLHGHVFDGNVELRLEIFGEAAEALNEACLILIGNGRKHKGGRRLCSGGSTE